MERGANREHQREITPTSGGKLRPGTWERKPLLLYHLSLRTVWTQRGGARVDSSGLRPPLPAPPRPHSSSPLRPKGRRSPFKEAPRAPTLAATARKGLRRRCPFKSQPPLTISYRGVPVELAAPVCSPPPRAALPDPAVALLRGSPQQRPLRPLLPAREAGEPGRRGERCPRGHWRPGGRRPGRRRRRRMGTRSRATVAAVAVAAAGKQLTGRRRRRRWRR